MDDLAAFAIKFKTWRGDRRHRYYPKWVWDEIQTLGKKYSIPIIAKTASINQLYLRKKLAKLSEEFTFAPLSLTSSSVNASIEFVDQHSRIMIVRFQADFEQLTKIILSLSGAK